MENDKDKGNVEYCVDCLNFKTVNVTEYNLPCFFFCDNKDLKNSITKSDFGRIKVYYCKKSKTSHAIYFSKRRAYALTSNTCECKEYDT